jgi:hypothetical protein
MSSQTARLSSVEPLGGFVLRLSFEDGAVREVDLEDELWGPAFEPLGEDPGLLRMVRVDDELGTIAGPSRLAR